MSPNPSSEIQVLHSDWREYALLDSGGRRKLERFGAQVVVRDEPKAWWEPALPEAEWARAQIIFKGGHSWQLAPGAVREWSMRWRELTLQARLTDTSKHLGIFPEQTSHWEFIQAQARGFNPKTASVASTPPKAEKKYLQMLNLFGYTGAATLAAAAAGFAVTHVDASKPAITWARHNQELSGLADAPIRWILDDAVKFVRREIRRGARYDALVLDPPSYGRGAAGELWRVETNLPELLDLCRQILAEQPRFVLLTLYNLEASSLMLGNVLGQMMRGIPGRISQGELALAGPPPSRLLPMSLWAKWERGEGGN
jgi:23S rRNA (cytosine1962-C5)-methyltransferase